MNDCRFHLFYARSHTLRITLTPTAHDLKAVGVLPKRIFAPQRMPLCFLNRVKRLWSLQTSTPTGGLSSVVTVLRRQRENEVRLRLAFSFVEVGRQPVQSRVDSDRSFALHRPEALHQLDDPLQIIRFRRHN